MAQWAVRIHAQSVRDLTPGEGIHHAFHLVANHTPAGPRLTLHTLADLARTTPFVGVPARTGTALVRAVAGLTLTCGG